MKIKINIIAKYHFTYFEIWVIQLFVQQSDILEIYSIFYAETIEAFLWKTSPLKTFAKMS